VSDAAFDTRAAGAPGPRFSLREALLLEDAEAEAEGYATGAVAAMRAFVRAGADRALVAERALDGHPASALSLYREAAVFYMAARVRVSADGELAEPLAAREVVARFRDLVPRHPPPCGPRELETFLAFVALAELRGGVDPASEPGTRRAAESARVVVRWLGTLVEPRGLDELRFVRRVRLGLVTAVVVALAALAAASLLGPKNLALHKPVTMSVVHPASSAVPGGLTDGVVTGAAYGAHTSEGENPWVQVDLLAVYALDKVAIYNRGDGRFDEGLPMTLQLSQDGVRFADVATRTTVFTQTEPWVAKPHGELARYVRVRGARGKYVALSELEVFGHAAAKR
jgi:hypothetical protein